MSRLLMLFSLTLACRSAPAEVPPPTTPSPVESRATAMPESLRCDIAADCAPEPNCYWSTPRCVAVASIAVAEKCGSDADPQDSSKAAVTCACQAGQCVASSSQ